MNGFGVGLTVAAGILIALALRAPDVGSTETLITVLFWSFLVGSIVELYRLALQRGGSRR
jgi:hypothetical protein